MNGVVGHVATLSALLLAVFGAVAAFVGGRRRDAQYVTMAQRAGVGVFALVALAFVIMERALITHDFSVSYVAQVGSRATPLFYTIISLWSALEGSILLWALILSIYTALLALWTRRHTDPRAGVDPQMPYALGTLFFVNIFFPAPHLLARESVPRLESHSAGRSRAQRVVAEQPLHGRAPPVVVYGVRGHVGAICTGDGRAARGPAQSRLAQSDPALDHDPVDLPVTRYCRRGVVVI